MDALLDTLMRAGATLIDVLPIAAVLVFFQGAVLRHRPPDLHRILIGFAYVLVGLTLFLVGLERALFPLGKTMAEQLTAPAFVAAEGAVVDWRDYGWVYAFGAAVGFASAIAEPALIAVSLKAEQMSGGAIRSFGLRLAVAVGVAVGVALGTYRIVVGGPLPYFIMAAYVILIIQTARSPRAIVPLAFDTGGVTTSTVTVPVVAALGLGLASTIPGRSPLVDGFGLIAFACLFPIMSVLGYAMLTSWLIATRKRRREGAEGKEKAS